MIEVVEYLDEDGRLPFAIWFKRLNPQVAARIVRTAARLDALDGLMSLCPFNTRSYVIAD